MLEEENNFEDNDDGYRFDIIGWDMSIPSGHFLGDALASLLEADEARRETKCWQPRKDNGRKVIEENELDCPQTKKARSEKCL